MIKELKACADYFHFINLLYESGCCEVTSQGEEDIDNLFSQEEKDRVISAVFARQITAGKPDFEAYRLISNKLTEAIEVGMSFSFEAVNPAREILRMAEDLRDNVFIFSGAKTHQEALEMSLNLLDPLGNPRSFTQFKEIAGKIFDRFRNQWLKTEFVTAERMSEGAANWMSIQDEKDIFPSLQYQTIGDARVRPEHMVLNKITRPVDDAFWDTFFPPNGFRCRCSVTKQLTTRATPLANKKLPELGNLFDFNVGKKRLIFAPEHPFFRVRNRFRALQKTNFGFPFPARQTPRGNI